MRRCPLCAGHGVTPFTFPIPCGCGCEAVKMFGGPQSCCPACGGVGQVPIYLDCHLSNLIRYGQHYWLN